MSRPPNILVFMTDQQRACSVLPGHPYKALTPCLDAFREEAITFPHAYGPSPHCCPARATFMTGLMPSQHGVWHNVTVGNAITRGLKPGVRPWSQDLRAGGYHLAFAGKWHVSNHQQPQDYGWEHLFPASMCHGAGLSPAQQERAARERDLKSFATAAPAADAPERYPAEIVRAGWTRYAHYGTQQHPLLAPHFRDGEEDNPFGDRTVVDKAINYLDGARDHAPWCLFVGTLGPHDPYIPPQRFLDLYRDTEFPLPATFDDRMEDKPALYRRTRDRFDQLSPAEHQEAIRHYLAFCSYEDWLFGRVVEQLKAQGMYEDTLILYVSDHGDYLGDHGLWCKGLPAFLSAYHVPAIMKVPGGPQGVVRNEFVSLADFGPTFLDAAGLSSPTAFAGQSLLPLCADDTPAAWRDALFFQSNGNETYGIQRSVLTEKWRFVYNGFDYDELYDLEQDPEQITNLARDPAYRPVIQALYEKLWTFGLAHEDHLFNDYIMTALADYGPGMVLWDHKSCETVKNG